MSISISQTDNVGLTVESDPLALKKASNLSDLTDSTAARTNLSLSYSSIAEAFTNNPSPIRVHSAINDQIAQCTSSVFTHAIQNWNAVTSGGGNAFTSAWLSRRDFVAPLALTAGYAGAYALFWANAASAFVSFNKPIVFSGRFYSANAASNAGVKARFLFSVFATTPTATALTGKGFGWEFDYGTLVMSIVTHDGTSQTSTPVSGFTLTGFKTVDIALYLDGAGNVSFYSNGVLLTTATATGLTGTSSPQNAMYGNFNLFQDVTTVTGSTTWFVSNPKLYLPIV